MMGDPYHIEKWQRLEDRVTTSGFLTESDLDDLKSIGVRHVINLALDGHEKALSDQEQKVETRGMSYTHIPVPFDAPLDEHFQKFCDALDATKNGPVHVHCIANYRVSAFFYRYHRDVLGMPEEWARAFLREQWEPDRVDRPETKPWAEFIR